MTLPEMAHWLTSIRPLLQPGPDMAQVSADQYDELRSSIIRTVTVDDVPVRYVPASMIEKLALDAVAWRRRFPRHERNGRPVYVVSGRIPTTVLENLLIELQHRADVVSDQTHA